MEPFRPLIADQAALSGLNNGQFGAGHFTNGSSVTLLSEEGRRLALELLEARFSRAVVIEGREQPLTWRQVIGVSARSLSKALTAKTAFEPVERA